MPLFHRDKKLTLGELSGKKKDDMPAMSADVGGSSVVLRLFHVPKTAGTSLHLELKRLGLGATAARIPGLFPGMGLVGLHGSTVPGRGHGSSLLLRQRQARASRRCDCGGPM